MYVQEGVVLMLMVSSSFRHEKQKKKKPTDMWYVCRS